MSVGDMAPDVQGALEQAQALNEQRRLDVENACLQAIKVCAQNAASADDQREVRECGQAALSFAQAVVILDPSLVAPQGVPPDALHPPLPHIQQQQRPGQNGAQKQ